MPPFVTYPNSVEDGRSDDSDTTYTLRLAYDLTSNVTVYGGVSTGFKATSWNLSQDTGPVDADLAALLAAGDSALPALTAFGLPPGFANYPGALGPATRLAGPEESEVWEIGLKGAWDSVTLNVAVFDQEIDGFQSNVFSGTGFLLANAGKQSNDGVEVDVTWAPTDGLRIGFAATWLDPVYDDFKSALGINGPEDFSGRMPAGIPEFSANTNITYSFGVGSTDGYVRLENVYESEVQVADNVSPTIASRQISLVNASAGLTFNNGIQLNLWGRNLTGDEYLQSAFPSVAQAGSFSGYPSQPRTYGLTITYNFE